MNNSTKGVLWSGLAFPGLGQVVLKHYLRGAALILTASVCTALIVGKIVQQANDLFERIQATGVSISTDDISSVVIELMPDSGGPSYRILALIITGCWLVGIVDAYMIGRRLDIEQCSAESGPDLSKSIKWE